ncbi:MAG: hypothetical protein J6Q48_04195 [Bacteroidaceae bacterium]|nr:hypothetical protein [Bacteroidaceae bacterium]
MNGSTIIEVLSSGITAEIIADFESRISALEDAESAKTTTTTRKKAAAPEEKE